MTFRKAHTGISGKADLSGNAKNRLFIGLVRGTGGLVCLFLVLLCVVPHIGFRTLPLAVS